MKTFNCIVMVLSVLTFGLVGSADDATKTGKDKNSNREGSLEDILKTAQKKNYEFSLMCDGVEEQLTRFVSIPIGTGNIDKGCLLYIKCSPVHSPGIDIDDGEVRIYSSSRMRNILKNINPKDVFSNLVYKVYALSQKYAINSNIDVNSISVIGKSKSIITNSKTLKDKVYDLYKKSSADLWIVYFRNTQHPAKDICLLINPPAEKIIMAFTPPKNPEDIIPRQHIWERDAPDSLGIEEQVQIKALVIGKLLEKNKRLDNNVVFLNVDYQQLMRLITLLPKRYTYKINPELHKHVFNKCIYISTLIFPQDPSNYSRASILGQIWFSESENKNILLKVIKKGKQWIALGGGPG